MQVITNVAELRRALADVRKAYKRIGFVPTMGIPARRPPVPDLG
ncbi:hypothetical protein EAV90_13840 [Bradyrhizobium vignae]|nr:hypothetical protein EAV90_13840 [Bradyrhizobium vignae]